ncbi:MAG: ABC transporter ATP-binding protein [Clostridiaceae bacterium]|nr:ABC transporter ATP-binding protein [Clostridiaceae bacterium]
MKNVLEVQNISKRYKNFHLKSINFKLDESNIMGIVGPNGSGKTTTIKIILGLINPDKGEVRIFGKKMSDNETYVKNLIGYVPDENHYPDQMTPLFIGKMMSGIYKYWDSKYYNSYLDKYELPHKQTVGTFSKGMKMKLSLAAALSHHAKLIILDEPTAGIDLLSRNLLLNEVKTICKTEEMSFLLSTHIPSDLEKIADILTIIKNGEMICSHTIADLKKINKSMTSLEDILINIYSKGEENDLDYLK